MENNDHETMVEANLSQAFINSLPGIFYVFDQQGKFVRWNRTFEAVTGWTAEEIAAAHVLDFFGAPAEKALLTERIEQVFTQGSTSVEASLRTKSGAIIPYYFNGNLIELEGKFCCCGMGIDITARRKKEAALHLRNRAIEQSITAIIIVDTEGAIEYANPAFERIVGYPSDRIAGRDYMSLLGSEENRRGLAKVRDAMRQRDEGSALLCVARPDGEMLWVDLHVSPVRNAVGKVSHFVGVLNDITDLKRYEEQLEHQANYDTLTELPNRSVLKGRIRQAIAAADRHGTGVTVGFMDLDNFKFVNDSLGHTVGDELLKCVAQRLISCIRAQDTVGRYGGDEFAFVLADLADEKKVAGLLGRVLAAVGQPFEIGGHEVVISCSIGVSFYPKDGHDIDTLLKNADTAMYRAKEAGRNNFQFYTATMNQRVNERLMLERKLRQALANDEFELHYQPKVHLGSGKTVGIEALLRWRPAGGEAIEPSAFIPLAEETGLIVPIGDWVLSTACAHNKALQDAGLPPMGVAVNISARQLNPNQLGTSILRALDASGLDSEYLELELTESLVMQDPEEVIGILLHLKQMGLRLTIDDFGTGYSSLSYLQRLPVDGLKIDQSFVRDIGADPNDAIIARAVISLGHSLGLSVIAEGVSKPEQLNFLRENGCDEMQGFLYSRPLPFGQLRAWLQENRRLNTH
ncbi:MAG: hypothetical protein V7606_3013 [Burkholderiales bacterium]